MSQNKSNLIAVLIITIATVLGILSFWDDSLIVDEIPHIGAGYSYLEKQDMRMNPEHPPLAKDIGALPLLFLNFNDSVFQHASWESNDYYSQWSFGRNLIFNSGIDAQKVTRIVKFPMLIFFILSAWLVFKWTKEKYGDRAGLLAIFLFSFSPTILAHSRLVTTDIPAMFGSLLAVYCLVNYIKYENKKWMLISGLAVGLAFCLKFSTILLIPFMFLISIIIPFWKNSNSDEIYKNLAKSFGKMILIGLIAIATVWIVYILHSINYNKNTQIENTDRLLAPYGKNIETQTIKWMSDKPIIRSLGHYALGLYLVQQRAQGNNTIFYRGDLISGKIPTYFPFVYLIKEPLSWLILLFIAICFSISKFKTSFSGKYKSAFAVEKNIEEISILLFIAIYLLFSINSSLNIGIRHILPVYPFIIILVSGQIFIIYSELKNKLSKRKILVLSSVFYILLTWYFIENIKVFPNYITYFNETVKGPSGGYNYVVDSNLDWGQDLKRFGDWVKENNVKKIRFDYFGWSDPSYYLNDAYQWTSGNQNSSKEKFIENNDGPGWLAVSAQWLKTSIKESGNLERNYNWLDKIKPITVIGNSIFVYYIK